MALDAGAAFFPHPYLIKSRQKNAERTAEGIGRAMAAMHIGAIGVSPFDLAAGADFLNDLGRKNKLPLLSANLFPAHGTNPLFRPYILRKTGNMTIAVIGLTGKPQQEQAQEKFHILPWTQTLPGIMDEVTHKADLVILLSSYAQKTNEKIAERYKDINIIFEAGQGGGNQMPININNTLLCRVTAKGKYVGVMQIDWNSSKTWGDNSPDRLKKSTNRLDRINWQLSRMQKRHPAKELAGNLQYQRLVKGKQELEQLIKTLTEKKDSSLSLCRYKNTFVAMETNLPKDKAVTAIVDQTKREVNMINRRQQQERQRRKKQGKTTDNSGISAIITSMAGSRACKKCHPAQVAFYLQTDHARAWQTLIDKNQQYNPDCIGCHVTLPSHNLQANRRGDLFADIPAKLHNVGCESCHGPALEHSQKPESILPAKPQQTTCRRCHTQKRDRNFDYSKKIIKVKCPAG